MSRSSGGLTKGPGAGGLCCLGPSLCPLWPGNIAAPILLWFVVVRRRRAWPVRWSCALVRVRPPVGTPHGGRLWGVRGRTACRSSCVPLPGVKVLSRGGGTPPRPRGGIEGRGLRGPQTGREVGGGGEGGPRRSSLLLRPGGRPVAPGPVPLPLRRTPPGYTRVAGQSWAPGVVRSAASGSVRGGGGVPSLWPAPPPSPGGHQGGPPPLRIPRRHRAVAAQVTGAEPPAGSGLCGSERAADRGRLARGCVRRGCGVSPLGAAAPPGGCGAAVSLDGPRPPTYWGVGEGGLEGGGSPVSPPSPLVQPPDSRGGAAWWFWSWGGQPQAGGGVLFPRLPSALGCRALAQALVGVTAVATRCRLAGGGEGRCVLGAVVG